MAAPLYDCFICHATEDKDGFVRPLAQALRERRVEVWYDEFSLRVGDSLRQSIDRGLTRSRFGVVVLSPSFFVKKWTNWELDGLLQRQLYEPPVILPVWHQIDRATLVEYSPSLADKVAINSRDGIDSVVDQLLRVMKPEGSALIEAREITLAKGLATPVISDDWWLDVVEDASWQSDRRLAFSTFMFSPSRGGQIAWSAMQMCWQQAAEKARMFQTKHPSEVLAFINAQPGLREACELDPRRLAGNMPQLTIPGFGGDLERLFDQMHGKSRVEWALRRSRNDPTGSGLTTEGKAPVCDEEWAFHDPDLGFYEPATLACGFVMGFSAGLGPSVRGMPIIDYLVWLLSSASNWLPPRIHARLLEGLKEWSVWPDWGNREDEELGYHVEWQESLRAALHGASGIRSFRLSKEADADLRQRIAFSVSLQQLPEEPPSLVNRFFAERFIERWFAANPARVKRRTRRDKNCGETNTPSS